MKHFNKYDYVNDLKNEINILNDYITNNLKALDIKTNRELYSNSIIDDIKNDNMKIEIYETIIDDITRNWL